MKMMKVSDKLLEKITSNWQTGAENEVDVLKGWFFFRNILSHMMINNDKNIENKYQIFAN